MSISFHSTASRPSFVHSPITSSSRESVQFNAILRASTRVSPHACCCADPFARAPLSRYELCSNASGSAPTPKRDCGDLDEERVVRPAHFFPRHIVFVIASHNCGGSTTHPHHYVSGC